MVLHHFFVVLLGISCCFFATTMAEEAMVGAEKAKANQFPGQVSLRTIKAGHMCGGGIIDDLHILTAGHCVVNADGKFDEWLITVVAGALDADHTDPPAVRIEAEKAYVPNAYKHPHDISIADIAVIKLKHAFHFSHHISKLHLPKHHNDNYEHKTATIAGYGMNVMNVHAGKEYGSHTDFHLRFAVADVITNHKCQEGYKDVHIQDHNICARVKQHHGHQSGVCNGDSGGPLIHDHTIIGVLSMNPFGCTEEHKAGIYTRVSHYLAFIHDAIHDHHKDMRVHVYDSFF